MFQLVWRRVVPVASAMALLVGVFTTLLVLHENPLPAAATSSPAGTMSNGGNTYFAYLKAGETLDIEFEKIRAHTGSGSDVEFRVTNPNGAVVFSCMIAALDANGTACGQAGLSGPAGVWKVEEIPLTAINTGTYLRPTSSSRYTWQIDVRAANGSGVPGRVWTDIYMGYDLPHSSDYDIDFWVATEFGALYSVALAGFTGGGWSFDSNAFGIVETGACTPLYQSLHLGFDTARYPHPGSGCGRPYWLFFEQPAADLPSSAPSADGTMVVLPPPSTPELTELDYQPVSNDSAAGTLTWSLSNFVGSYELRIDTNGNGSFDDATDRVVSLSGTSGVQAYEWDGLDADGSEVDRCLPIRAELRIDRADEVHFVLPDVEGLSRGIEVRQLAGNTPGNTTLYWDDTPLPAASKTSTTPIIDATAGVDSTGGVHRWEDVGSRSWGDQAALDHWTYSDVDVRAGIDLGGGCLEVEKSSDATADARPGDVINYTVTATNVGAADFTEADPAFLFDDLSGVLDDASYNGDPVADQPGAVSFDSPRLAWSGPLAVGQSVTLTYSVTLTSGGDGSVRNVAWAPFDPEDPAPECVDAEDGRDPVTGVPCVEEEFLLPRLTIAKSADRDELPAVGESVEYTITVTNVGPGEYTAEAPASFVDDLSNVLDDAVYNGDAVASTGSVLVDGEEMSWTGPLAAGESASVTYSVTYTGAGDQRLRNLACVPEADVAPGAIPCDFTSVPGAGLMQWKQVSASSDPVIAGSVLTYTLFFKNDGEATATVDAVDDLTHVLDDGDVTAEPVVSGGPLTAVRNGAAIDISGDIGPGETASVTYQVTVRPDGERGDDVAANFLLERGEDPPSDPVCEPDDGQLPDCTTTPIGGLIYSKSVTASDDPVVAGTVLTYTIGIESTGEAAMPVDLEDVLTGVLDDADLTSDPVSDTSSVTVSAVTGGRFEIGGSLAGGSTAEVTYAVTVKAEADRGDNVAANFVVPAGTDPSGECLEADPACTATNMPLIEWSKSSDPDSGSSVVAGDEITYTLTFTNSGTATGPVVHTDHLAGVLDDALVTVEPTVSDPSLSAVRTDDEILITGDLAAGQSVTVTYTVVVNDDGERGDDEIGNVLARTGADPVCGEDGAVCTEHPVSALVTGKAVEADSDPVVAGTVLTYTLHFNSTGSASVGVDHTDVLTGVLDDAELVGDIEVSSDGLTAVLDQDEITVVGELDAGELATVIYRVRVKPEAGRGDNSSVNFLVPTGTEPPDECLEADPNCTKTNMPLIEWSKSSDPDSGDVVVAGQEITYTLTFTNSGTATGPVAHTDHLAGVLDDAEVTGEPTVSDPGLSAVRTGDEISITGDLDAGESVTVSYAVMVLPDGDRGDDVIGNVLARAGADPVCGEDGAVCTEHPVSALAAWKSVEADSSPVVAGTVLTYTLHFESVGAAPVIVDHVDDLTHVLDDADVTTEPTSDGLTVSRVGERISVTGGLDAGESATVTYQVTVRADGERGDDIAANFLLLPGEETPEDPVCEPADDEQPDCTKTTIGALETAKTVVADADPVVAGSELTYTLSFTNPGRGPIGVDHTDVLTDVLDDADLIGDIVVSDPAVTAALAGDTISITGQLEGGEAATVTYRVRVKPEADRGNNKATNFLVKTGTEPSGDCVEGDPNCTETPLPNIVTAKASDPESGASVAAGDEITYLLTFTNTGEAAGPVAHVDDLTGVLDDAELISGPTVHGEGITVTRDGERLDITGTLAAGESATVAYIVKVLPDDDRGDHVLTNFLFPEDEEPPTECVVDDPNCVRHPVGYITPTKTVDPASGTTVGDDTVLTYTLRFVNNGEGLAAVDHTDHLAGVLDDAIWLDDVAIAGDLTVEGPTDGRLGITGTLQAGETATVTYKVRVKPYGDQGDHVLANFLTDAGENPPAECVDDSELCTLNQTEEQPPPPEQPGQPNEPGQPGQPGQPPSKPSGPTWLPRTGAQIGAAALIGLLLLGAGLGLQMSTRRRYNTR